MATLLQMRTEVLNHGFGPEYATRVTDWLNIAQARIARMVEIRELLTKSTQATANGTQDYSVPADFVRLLSIVDDVGNRALDPQHPYYIDALPTASGRPTMYAISSEGFRLWPIPDAIYSLTIRYYKDPTDLSTDGSTSVLPADYHDVMISFALSRAYRAEDDAQMAAFFYQEFERDLLILGGDRAKESLDPKRPMEASWEPKNRADAPA